VIRALRRARICRGALLLILLLGGCLARAEPSDLVRARPFEPRTERPGPFEVGRLRFEAGFVLTSSDRRFGGLSGLLISADGRALIAVSDRGLLWTAALRHDGDGRLLGLDDWVVIDLATIGDGAHAASGDAEALAPAGEHGLVIAYEGAHRLLRIDLDDLSDPPSPLPMPSGLAPGNEGIEALAALPDGDLLALAEGIRDAGGDLAAWRISETGIDRLSYVPTDGFVPTGADRLDDRIYLVERRFSLLGGFASRVAVLPVAALEPGARLRGAELARLGPTSISENFEGIAARRGPDGRILLYLVSDDNFLALQQTLLLQFSLLEP
jgi:hypothetical protein